MKTIFAVSSGRPPAAIAIIRLSGSRAFAAGEALGGRLPAVGQAGLRALRDSSGALLDRALVLRFAAPGTATGEDLVELHCHGGRAVVDAVERALGCVEGVRRAHAGEFTRRAMMNGRIDLAEAQGFADLLEAQTERQRVAAIVAAEGVVSRSIRTWQVEITALSARVEALLDFSDEDDVRTSGDAEDALVDDIKALGRAIAEAAGRPSVERLHEGVRVVIAGPPNSGKSTLLNLMAERDAAIVSPIAGTTRDRIEAQVVRDGIVYVITDTAGLVDASKDPIERIGVTRAQEAMAGADILLWLGDDEGPEAAINVHSRADLPGRHDLPGSKEVAICRNDPGSIEHLWSRIARAADAVLPRTDDLPLRRAQREACRSVADELLSVCGLDLLVTAERLRTARNVLGAMRGENATEAMLDALFARFCIGK